MGMSELEEKHHVGVRPVQLDRHLLGGGVGEGELEGPEE